MIAGETEPPSDDRKKPITVHSGHKTPGVIRPLEGEEDEASGPSDVKGGCLPKQKKQQSNPEANATGKAAKKRNGSQREGEKGKTLKPQKWRVIKSIWEKATPVPRPVQIF